MDRQTTAAEYGRTKVEGVDVGTALRWLENQTGLVFDGDEPREMTDEERQDRGLYRGHAMDEVTEDGIVEAEHGKRGEDPDKKDEGAQKSDTPEHGPEGTGVKVADADPGRTSPEELKAQAEAAGAKVMTKEELEAKGAKDAAEAAAKQEAERHALEGPDAHTPPATDPHHDEVIAAMGAEKAAETAAAIHAERHAGEGPEAWTEPNLDPPKDEAGSGSVVGTDAPSGDLEPVGGATGERAADGDADRDAKVVGGDGPLGAPSGEVVVGSKETGDKAAVKVPGKSGGRK